MTKKGLLEAVLFLSGKALTERQLAAATGVTLTGVRRLLPALAKEFQERGGGLEVVRRGRRWAFQVKEEYRKETASLAPATLPKPVLKTAGLIAYHQPVKQSHLVRISGPKAYDHVRRLRELGLISARPHGRTLLISTTSKFLEFFGLDAGSKEELREIMAERVTGKTADSSEGVIISS